MGTVPRVEPLVLDGIAGALALRPHDRGRPAPRTRRAPASPVSRLRPGLRRGLRDGVLEARDRGAAGWARAGRSARLRCSSAGGQWIARHTQDRVRARPRGGVETFLHPRGGLANLLRIDGRLRRYRGRRSRRLVVARGWRASARARARLARDRSRTRRGSSRAPPRLDHEPRRLGQRDDAGPGGEAPVSADAFWTDLGLAARPEAPPASRGLLPPLGGQLRDAHRSSRAAPSRTARGRLAGARRSRMAAG